MDKRKWIVLNYSLPTEPSRPRVALWRHLKKLGAICIQQSMWIMIYSHENLMYMQEISKDIEANNGTYFLMESTFFEDVHEQRIIMLFNEMRDEEYGEFINECNKYLKELEKEISIEKFTFAELEEEEEELNKLKSWHKNIKARDIFHSNQRIKSDEFVDKISISFENYSDMVYRNSLEK